jgi:hypothetical protein
MANNPYMEEANPYLEIPSPDSVLNRAGKALVQLPRGLAESGAAMITGLTDYPIATVGRIVGRIGGLPEEQAQGFGESLTSKFQPETDIGKETQKLMGRLLTPIAEATIEEPSRLVGESWKSKQMEDIAKLGMLGITAKATTAGKAGVKQVSEIAKGKVDKAFKGVENVIPENPYLNEVYKPPPQAEFVRETMPESDLQETLRPKETVPYKGEGSYWDYLDKLNRQQTISDAPINLPEGKLSGEGTIVDSRPVELTPTDQMKYDILSKSDPATWNGTDKIFMDKLGEKLPEVSKVESNIINPYLQEEPLIKVASDFQGRKELQGETEITKLPPVEEKPGTANIPAKENPVAEADFNKKSYWKTILSDQSSKDSIIENGWKEGIGPNATPLDSEAM